MRTLISRSWTKPCFAAVVSLVFFVPMLSRGTAGTGGPAGPRGTVTIAGAVAGARLEAARTPLRASPSPVPARAAAAPPPARLVPDTRLDLFRGLGAWVDLFDFSLDPVRTVAMMKSHGVRTLYIQTGRSNTARGLDPRTGRWLIAAHRAGMKVVGWYLPMYLDVERDIQRTVAIRKANFAGHRFDGLGVDIEYRPSGVPVSTWNRRVVAVNAGVRRAVGSFPVAAIVPPPLQLAVAPGYWAGFPWQQLARSSDGFLLMSYWSDRTGCPRVVRHCAFNFTRDNVTITRRLAGRPILVHVIGGVADSINRAQVDAFVRGAIAARADGASMYDVQTTPLPWWRALSALRSLGARSA